MAAHALRLVKSAFDVGQTTDKPNSVVLIGSYSPRRCGIATFTSDVYACLVAARPNLRCDVFAMTDHGGPYDYPPEVTLEIPSEQPMAYQAAAAKLGEINPDVVFVQHEFGIYGGPAGEHLMLLLEATDRPIVTLLHTVLDQPDPDQRRIFERLLARSARLIVMAVCGA